MIAMDVMTDEPTRFSYSARLCDPTNRRNDISVRLAGPKDSPFAGGVYELEMTIPDDYPIVPPRLCQLLGGAQQIWLFGSGGSASTASTTSATL